MKRPYFDCPIQALIAHKFQGISLIVYAEQFVEEFEHAPATSFFWLHTCRVDGYGDVHMADCLIQEFLATFEGMKIYVQFSATSYTQPNTQNIQNITRYSHLSVPVRKNPARLSCAF